MPGAELRNRGNNFFLYRTRGQRAVFFEQCQQPRLTKLLTIGVACFRHTVGKQNHTIARYELDSPRFVALLPENAENSPAFAQALVRTIRMHDKRRIVAGVGVAEEPSPAIQLRVEKSDETVAMRVPPHQSIQTAAHNVRVQGWRGKSTDGRLQVRHQQRCRNSLPSHVRNAQA